MTWVTLFDDYYAKTTQGEDMDLEGLARLIAEATAPDKDSQPLLKMARFGANRDPQSGALRHDGNVTAASGGEGDHDSGSMTLQEAARRLDDAGVAYIAYTTFSHTAAAPRWRVLCPFSKELPPAMRSIMVNRVNGVLGGVLQRESWPLSQAFFTARSSAMTRSRSLSATMRSTSTRPMSSTRSLCRSAPPAARRPAARPRISTVSTKRRCLT
jgi:hypothetical protein